MALPSLPVLLALAMGLLLPVIIVALMRLTVERIRPMEPARRGGAGLNLLAYAVWRVADHLFAPAASMALVLLINHLGGGWIVLPAHGPGLVLGFVVYALALDLGEYLFHRAEHAIPALWSLHSLHHSDSRFDASTSVLHHWAAPLIHSLAISTPLALLFKAPPVDVMVWGLISNHVFLMHANLKWDFGRFWWLLTSPVYHRTHHSALPEHFDCNYASLFPVWDVLFGSVRRVDAETPPPVGLGEGGEARSLSDIVLWPARGWIARLAPGGAQSAS